MNEESYFGYKTYDKISNQMQAFIYEMHINNPSMSKAHIGIYFGVDTSRVYRIIRKIKSPVIDVPVTIVRMSEV